MATEDKANTITLGELMVHSLAMADALAKLLIEKGFITNEEFMKKVATESITYQAVLQNKMG